MMGDVMNLYCGRRCLGGAGVLALAGVEGLVALVGRSVWRRVGGPSPAGLPDLVVLSAAALAFVLGLWLAAGLALAVLERAPGWVGALARPLARRCAPAVSRRWAALFL